MCASLIQRPFFRTSYPLSGIYWTYGKCTSSAEFSFNDTMYKQTDGGAMDSPLGPALANIFVGYFDSKLFSCVQKPTIYFWYVDDTFAIFEQVGSAVATVGPGGSCPPLTAAHAPHFGLLKILFLKHHVMMTIDNMMEKEIIITFKHNFRLTFLDSVQNCWQPIVVHKCGAIIRLISTPLRSVTEERCKLTELLPVLF